MGRTAVNIVSRNMTVVEGKYGDYARSKHNHVKSKRLIAFHSCVRQAMEGKGGSAEAIKESFKAAAKNCSGRGGAPMAAGRRMSRRF